VSYGTAGCGFPLWDNKAQSIGPYVSWIDEAVARFDSGTFIDDDDSIHEADIEWLAASGITKGCNPPANDKFCPKASVTRGQVAAFIRRALKLPFSETDYFVDDDDSVFEADINAVAEAGITKGCNPPANDRFCPDRTVTRDQMAAFLRRSFDYPASDTDYFTDDDGSIFEGDINAIAEMGVTKGCNPPVNDRYCPTNKVTREQMASFLRRTLE
jgi:S-layer homology domain